MMSRTKTNLHLDLNNLEMQLCEFT
jgi:hypothetical protein